MALREFTCNTTVWIVKIYRKEIVNFVDVNIISTLLYYKVICLIIYSVISSCKYSRKLWNIYSRELAVCICTKVSMNVSRILGSGHWALEHTMSEVMRWLFCFSLSGLSIRSIHNWNVQYPDNGQVRLGGSVRNYFSVRTILNSTGSVSTAVREFEPWFLLRWDQ